MLPARGKLIHVRAVCDLTCLCPVRVDPACLPLCDHSPGEPGASSGDRHTPLCSGEAGRASRHPLDPGAGGGGVCFSGLVLVGHGGGGGTEALAALPAPRLLVVRGLLHVHRYLPAFYVSLPASIHSHLLHRAGLRRLVPLCRSLGTRCQQTGV